MCDFNKYMNDIACENTDNLRKLSAHFHLSDEVTDHVLM